MDLVDVRRLTGPNHIAWSPLVIAELSLDPTDDRARVRALYEAELARMRAALGLAPSVAAVERPHAGGTVIGYPAPIDVMLACAEMSEWAALSAREILAGRSPAPLEPRQGEIARMLEEEREPRLLALEAEAGRRGVPLLWDDEAVSVGTGRLSLSFARGELPDVASVPWDRLGRIPIALVTGTNGKTTSTRLLGRVAREAGRRVAVTSSDGVSVGGEVVEEGDWTGPAAARLALRRADVDLAVLETARGGILRRGLAVDACDVALVTNVSDDHVGGYGVDDLDAMARVKGVVVLAARARRPPGTSVLNARDARLVALAEIGDPTVIFFADLEGDAGSAGSAKGVVDRHRARGGTVVVTSGGAIVRIRGAGAEEPLVGVAEVPLAFGGAARFNVENALGVVGAATALGLTDDAIARALRGFVPAENPRRTALLERGGVHVMLDFGHNPEGVRAALQLVASRRAGGRLTVITGAAGDRGDREIADVARAIWAAGPDRVLVRELPDYLRGRAPGEVPEIFRRALVAEGLPPAAFGVAASEVDGLRAALADAKPGDFVVLLIHLDHAEVQAFLGGGAPAA